VLSIEMSVDLNLPAAGGKTLAALFPEHFPIEFAPPAFSYRVARCLEDTGSNFHPPDRGDALSIQRPIDRQYQPGH